jgi:hypothetical protein
MFTRGVQATEKEEGYRRIYWWFADIMPQMTIRMFQNKEQ